MQTKNKKWREKCDGEELKKEKGENWDLSWCKREVLDSSYLYITLFIMQDSLNLRSKERMKKKESQQQYKNEGKKTKRSKTTNSTTHPLSVVRLSSGKRPSPRLPLSTSCVLCFLTLFSASPGNPLAGACLMPPPL